MRIALDLQACQTESRWRGIGRYARDFSRALLELRGGRDMLVGIDGTYPTAAAEVRSQFASLVAPSAFRSYRYPGPNVAIGSPGDGLRPAAEALVRRAYAAMGADVVHVNSLFEGFIEHAAGLGRLAGIPGSIGSVTLYDLIPAVMPDWYLHEEPYRSWYIRKLHELGRFDTVLCISEATRRAAIDLLGLQPEKLATIHAGVADEYFDIRHGLPLDPAIASRYGIRDDYVLYTGNGDPRKNLGGAIEAFAGLPAAQRARTQLVLNQVGDVAALRTLARRAGLAEDRVVVTGHVSDRDLVELIASCSVFFFPSLYEGFGLPVLEAMACGAPAICGDNSSLPEVMGRADAMFDAARPESASAKLAEVLGDAAFRDELARSGRERARAFTWRRSAGIALEAWDEAQARQRRRIASAGGMPRPRVALVTPLPPERTGIADYVMELLPALRGAMDIELYTTAPLDSLQGDPQCHLARPWTRLEEDAARFDHVIYQVGNSPFHSHMLELMRRVPGTVVLHDFFLSSLLGYLDEHEQREGLFAAELERSHGAGAIQRLHLPGGRAEAVHAWPASRLVFDSAESVIVHSQHSVELARAHYGGAARAPLRRVPMPQRVQAADPARRRQARQALGIADATCLVVSFGFLADTKLNLELIDAFATQALLDADARLVFVGEPDGGEYGRSCRERIAAHPARDRIEITGFASAELYATYLRAADVAVQLRARSRGETSKSVLDCMAHGVPVIINDYGSFAELPDNAVVKLPAAPSPRDVAAGLLRLVEDADGRRRLGATGREYIAREHDPHLVARHYADAVRAAMHRRREQQGDRLVAALASALDGAFDPQRSVAAVEHAVRSVEPNRCPRLYVDVTDVVQQDHGTGIHRVVRNLLRHLVVDEGPALRCSPVVVDPSGAVSEAPALLATLGVRRVGSYPFEPASGDVLFLLDSTWSEPERFMTPITRIRDAGGRSVAMVYDLIPLLHPHHCIDFMPAVFERWLRFVVAECDALVCISRAVADELAAWVARADVPHRSGLRIGHIRLGSDLAETVATQGPSAAITAAMGGQGDAVLTVGTLEPRKRHELVLDAFERLWEAGDRRRLVLIGKEGWNVRALAERLRGHPRAGAELFWIEGAADADVSYAYARAERVVQASDAEGYGLPLVEAARHGCAVLASDLAVFREIGGDMVDYFPAGCVEGLVDGLRSPSRPPAEPAVASWRESAAEARDRLWGGPWDHVLP